MKRRKRPRSLKDQVLFVTLSLIIITTLSAVVTAFAFSSYQEQRSAENNLRNIAQLVSHTPAVATALQSGSTDEALQAFLDGVMEDTLGLDLLVVANRNGVRYYHPDHSLIGGQYTGSDQQRILAGSDAYLSQDTGVSGDQRRAYAGVRDESGNVLGFVMAGMLQKSVYRMQRQMLLVYVLIAAAVCAVGFYLSVRLSRNIKATLLGYEPDVLSRLFKQRQDILEALEEGILAINGNQEIIFINRAALSMLHIESAAPAGRPLHEVYPKSRLNEILTTGVPRLNVDMESLKEDRIISDQMPIREDGAVIGAVAIFRNRTEVTKLAEDLTGVRHMVEAMRTYTHEFMNKLHVILGLIQTRRFDEAVGYIMSVTMVQRENISFIMERIEDSSVAALLVGKTSRASELGIHLTLDPGSHLGSGAKFLPSGALVTLLGNLMENAFDALGEKEGESKEVAVGIHCDSVCLILTVDDTGSGMSRETVEKMFEKGFSTKGTGRGTGLALVKNIVDDYGGELYVDSEQGAGTSFTAMFRKSE